MAAELEAIPRCYGWGELPLSSQGHLLFQCYCIVCQGRMIWDSRCGVVDMILLFLEFHSLPEPAIGSVGHKFWCSVLDFLCVRARCAVRIPNLLFIFLSPFSP
jgi:hypothetical protein